MAFSLAERILLALLIVTTTAIFLRDLKGKIRLILPGKSDRVRTDKLGMRIARLVREVVFQSRVVGGRPVAGTLHAIVFLGFLTFGLETLDHFLEPYGIPLLHALLGSALPIFYGVLAVAAVLVTIAILSLAFRRFVLVKYSPDPTSYSSGVVAVLIALLMVTYLNGIQAAPWLAKANWWVHALIILAFPHLILRSKHFHILMAPVDVFLRTEKLGDYLPLNLDLEALEESDEEPVLGLETLGEMPWKMRMDFLTCVECKRCTNQCPAHNSGQELNPRGFILDGRASLDKAVLAPDSPVIGNVISETALGQCTSCGACEAICPVGIEHLQVLIGAKRAQALSTGKGMVAEEFLGRVENYGNPFSAPKKARKELIEQLRIPLYEAGKSEYLLWLGCVWNYNEDARGSLESMLRVLDAAGVPYGVLAEESCTGHHSRRQGEEMQFQTLAGENMERLREQGVRRIISPCPHCLHTFRQEYPTLDEGFEVESLHHSEIIARLVADGSLKLATLPEAAGKRVTYHDPCYLGRYEGVYDAPRELITRASGLPVVELPRNRSRSFCCGGGSAGFTREVEAERQVYQERKDEIAASGATTLITGCPECKMMLNAAVDETMDLVELVARSLPPSLPPRGEQPSAAPAGPTS